MGVVDADAEKLLDERRMRVESRTNSFLSEMHPCIITIE